MRPQKNRYVAIGSVVLLAVALVLVLGSINNTKASSNVQAAATMAATADMGASTGTMATMASTMGTDSAYPPCPPAMVSTMSATMVGTAAMMNPTMASTNAMMAPTAAATMNMMAPTMNATGNATMAPTMYFVAGTTVPGCSLTATLVGPNEVPKQGDPNGKGTATLMLSRPATGPGVVCFVIQVSGIKLPATTAHIHAGAAGIAGPVIVPLQAPDASGNVTGCTQNVDRDLIEAILTEPANYYVNVHNADFPSGAMRGQLSVSGQ